MPTRHDRCRRPATWSAFPLLLCCVFATSAGANPPSENTSPSAPAATPPAVAAPADAREPDLESCIAAFLAARGWLDAGETPPPSDPSTALPLPGTRGVAVILRHRGRFVGSGDDWPVGAGDDRMLRRAFARALARAVGDTVIAALPRDLRDSTLKELSLEIDFAGRPEPLVGRTFAECATRIEPGLDGIAMRRGGGNAARWAAVFPASMAASNLSAAPERGFLGLLGDLELPLKDLPDLVRSDPVGVFRFPSLRLAQTTPTEMPFIRGRGVQRYSDADVTPAAIERFAASTLSRLALSVAAAIPQAVTKELGGGGERGVEGLGLFGNYEPVPDQFTPLIAPPLEQALAAWAAASVSTCERFNPELRERAHRFAVDLLVDLALRTSAEESPSATTPPMAFALCAVSALGDPEKLPAPVREFASLAREKLGVQFKSGNVGDRALATMASAMALVGDGRVAGTTETRAALDALWTAATPPELVGHLPWLALAEVAYAKNTGQPVANGERALQILDVLLPAQAGFGRYPSDDDLRGGFRLTGAGRNSVNSQSLRPGLGLAVIASQPGYLPPERQADLVRRVRSLVRFAMELAVDERESLFFRNPPRCQGGVRVALWDSTMPVAANAMAILVATEAVEALTSPAPSQADAPDAPAPHAGDDRATTDPDDKNRQPPSEEGRKHY
ncbi:MAG: hypothetical protein JNM94_09665 [Phycisphaerae bacterium]|nr:hypothetical protein [Phycisphaerae bacterium]